MIADIGMLGKKPSAWHEWVERWNDDSLAFYERMGLLHYGFHIAIPQYEVGFEDRVARIAFYLRLANRAARPAEYLENGGREVAAKARSILVSKVFGGRSDDAAIVFGSPVACRVLLPLICELLCSRDQFGYGNWAYRKKGDPEIEDARLSSYFIEGILSLALNPKSSLSDPVVVERMLENRQRILSTAFLEAPSEFYIMVRTRLYVNAENPGFGEKDFRDLVEDLRGKGCDDADIPTLILDEEVRREVNQGVARRIGVRTIVTPIKHWEALILIGTLIEERRVATAKKV